MKKLTALAFSLALVGCVTVDPNAGAKMAEINATIPTCSQAKECEVKWAAARDWVLANAGMKIQNITDGYIETYGPGDSMDLAVRVVKNVLPDGSYTIKGKVWCGNPFGCMREPVDALLDFQRTVNASFHS